MRRPWPSCPGHAQFLAPAMLNLPFVAELRLHPACLDGREQAFNSAHLCAPVFLGLTQVSSKLGDTVTPDWNSPGSYQDFLQRVQACMVSSQMWSQAKVLNMESVGTAHATVEEAS